MAASAFIPFPARRININTAPQAHLNGRCGPDPAPALEVKGSNQSRSYCVYPTCEGPTPQKTTEPNPGCAERIAELDILKETIRPEK